MMQSQCDMLNLISNYFSKTLIAESQNQHNQIDSIDQIMDLSATPIATTTTTAAAVANDDNNNQVNESFYAKNAGFKGKRPMSSHVSSSGEGLRRSSRPSTAPASRSNVLDQEIIQNQSLQDSRSNSTTALYPPQQEVKLHLEDTQVGNDTRLHKKF
jgi:hypothetical protein